MSDTRETRGELVGDGCGQQHYISLVSEIISQQTAEAGRLPGVYIMTFGCQQNEADSERLAGVAEAMGYVMVDRPEEASLIIANTCAVREHAEQKALSHIGRLKHIKKENPAAVIVACGCMTAQEHRQNELKQRYPYVDIVLGSSGWQRLPELLYRRLSGERRLFCLDDGGAVPENLPVRREFSYKAWLPVMYGCDNYCSYCIVPYVRGRERSRRPEDILAEARELVGNGYRDITLLGQNVNSYGRDLGTGYDFAQLISDISAIEGDFRLRFMTSHPKDATRRLVDALAKSDKAARHFHLPLQSGSDKILKAMNRRYNRANYLDTVAYIRERMPDIALTSDIIVGFPGETDEDFEDTLDIIRRVRFDMIFSFVFSPRRGTPAADMDNQVPGEVKTQRYLALVELQNAISEEINKRFQGSVVRVLCDGPSKTDKSMYGGRTSGNKIVYYPGEQADIGNFVNVKVERTEAFALYGTKTGEPAADNR